LQLQPAGDSWTEQDTGALEHAIRCCQTGFEMEQFVTKWL
jgi:hypothetical protein